MRIVFLIISCLISHFVFAQQNTKPRGFNLDVGAGATYHTIFNNVNNGGGNAFANLIHLNIKYKDGILGYGLKFEHLQFVTEDDSAVVFKDAVANLLQYNTQVNLYEGKKIGLYLAAGIGVNGFQYQQRDTAGVFGKVKMEGFSGSIFFGMNYHFKGKFGVFAQMGYIANTDRLTEFRVNGNLIEEFQNREVSDVIYNMRGLDFKAGLRFAF